MAPGMRAPKETKKASAKLVNAPAAACLSARASLPKMLPGSAFETATKSNPIRAALAPAVVAKKVSNPSGIIVTQAVVFTRSP